MLPETMAKCFRSFLMSGRYQEQAMRWAICAATVLLAGFLPPQFAAAAEPLPTGEWRTANGLANVRIDDCDGILWGVISWEKEPGGLDSNNPNPAERNRPTLGLRILQSMKPSRSGQWQGEVYNPENGKNYDARISLEAPDVLKIEGCVLGFLCGGENWTRVKAEASPAQQPPGPQQRVGGPKDPPLPPLQPVPSACSSLADSAGTAHKSGLK
jgi:uncharacterized protein (DUF2147 family)